MIYTLGHLRCPLFRHPVFRPDAFGGNGGRWAYEHTAEASPAKVRVNIRLEVLYVLKPWLRHVGDLKILYLAHLYGVKLAYVYAFRTFLKISAPVA
jgi:hypothetical protein